MQNVNWEKIGIYIAVLIGFMSAMWSIGDIKERVARLEVRIDYSENKGK